MPTTVDPFTHRTGRVAIAATLLMAAALLASCTSDDANRADGGAMSTTTAAADPEQVEPFEGPVDEFNRAPDPLPRGAAGDVVRAMEIDAPAGTTGLRIMYLTTDADDDLRAATGTVYVPEGDAPEGGWPVVAWAHGTSGLAAKCAPSRAPQPPPGYGIQGVHVAADYLGLGPEGEVHPYLQSVAEGHAVIDSVAAVRSLPELAAGDDWVVAGVSQGGHAALVTNEMAAERLPGATLLGAVAMAPGAELDADHGDELQIRIITTMALVGAAAEDAGIELDRFLSPDVMAASGAIRDGCVGDIIDTMLPIAGAADYFLTDPRSDPVGQAWLDANNPGKVVGAAPLLLVQGGKDLLVLPARTAALFRRLCGIGQVVEMLDVPEADHNTVVELSETEVAAWLQARFAGEPPLDDCPT